MDKQKIELALNEDYIKKYFLRQKVYSSKDGLKKIEIDRLYRHDPNSYVIKYTLFFKNNKKKILFATGRSIRKNRKAYNIIKYLWKKGFSKGTFCLPRVLFCGFSSHLLFYEYIEGKDMIHFVLEENSKLNFLIKKTAQWLARLHNLKIKSKKISFWNLKENKKKRKFFLEVIEKNFPEYFSEIEKMLDKIFLYKKELIRKDKKNFVLIHGDFQPANLIFDGRKITIIDFEHTSFYQPMLDVACFLIHLEHLFYRYEKRNIDFFKKKFLDEYFSKSYLELTSETRKELEIFELWQAIEVLAVEYSFYSKPEIFRKAAEKVFLRVKNNLCE